MTSPTNTTPQPPLTPEQQAILRAKGNGKINAVAGSGKTTTALAYAAAQPPGTRILYLAFNKSVRLEAQQRFAAAGLHNIRVETAHSLAFKAIVPAKGYTVRPQGLKTHEVVELLGLKDEGEKHGAYLLAAHVARFVAYFCNSAAQKVQELNYLDVVHDEKAAAFVRTFYPSILNGTRLLLKKMHEGGTPVTHDFYLKLYQLSAPRLPFDCILFDEAQDASPAMLAVFLQQSATKQMIGDTHQQIYSWRYAVNSLEQARFPSYPLSVSFRFGPDIARLATAVLGWKNHIQPTGPVALAGHGTATTVQSTATLARSNLGLLLAAIDYITLHPKASRLYFEGNLHSYTYADDGTSLYDVLNLYNGAHDRIRDRLLASMGSLADLEEYIEKTEDPQLGMMVEVVNQWGNELPRLLAELKAKHLPDAERHQAEMVFSTVHRAKGMEYDEVFLVNDFITEARLQKLVAETKPTDALRVKWSEEVNLLYVAITRARVRLHLPEGLAPAGVGPSAAVRLVKPETARRAAASGDAGNRSDYRQTLLAQKNSGEFWTEDRDDELRRLFHNGVRLPGIAARFGCKQSAVMARLKKLGCVEG